MFDHRLVICTGYIMVKISHTFCLVLSDVVDAERYIYIFTLGLWYDLHQNHVVSNLATELLRQNFASFLCFSLEFRGKVIIISVHVNV